MPRYASDEMISKISDWSPFKIGDVVRREDSSPHDEWLIIAFGVDAPDDYDSDDIGYWLCISYKGEEEFPKECPTGIGWARCDPRENTSHTVIRHFSPEIIPTPNNNLGGPRYLLTKEQLIRLGKISEPPREVKIPKKNLLERLRD